MAHAIWSGAINFGLVTIPVKLYTAVRTNDLRFNFLHKKDDGRIYNERHCSVCGEKVEYADLVRGYEYEKGHYVTIGDDDLRAVRPEATQSVQIVEFVELDQINPMYFDTPYYLEPEKKGRHAYALLRDALIDSGRVAIARVVIRSREHIAAVKPNGEALVLELMHFADELVEKPEIHRPAATNVVNLMDVLQRSLEQSKARRKKGASVDDDEETAVEARPAKRKTAAKKTAPVAKPKRKKSAA